MEQKKNIERYEINYELNENGYFQTIIDYKTGEKEEIAMLFDSIREVIVGNNIKESYSNEHQHYVGKLMVFKYIDDQYYIREFFNEEEFYNWVARFQDKGVSFFQTDYDLRPAFLKRQKYQTDFNQLEGEPWDGKKFPQKIGRKIGKNRFLPWKPHEKQPVITVKQRTRKWEIRIGILLLVYALILGVTVLPWQPVDDDNAYWEIGILFIFGVIGINILLPIISVFWRAYTKWFLPFFYFLIIMAGHSIPAWIISLFTENPPMIIFIISTNIIILIGWVPVYILLKAGRGIFILIRKVIVKKDNQMA
ncbi:hypothetical protein [Oceanobacillus timonensis]|uniref:hypothetical protein n=1 Tax=Oceanobacillus timonensis TaxID=1926285 RepID=UPI0009BB164F|nr:hypothetical protein [Oceanobacillus timonensis]